MKTTISFIFLILDVYFKIITILGIDGCPELIPDKTKNLDILYNRKSSSLNGTNVFPVGSLVTIKCLDNYVFVKYEKVDKFHLTCFFEGWEKLQLINELKCSKPNDSNVEDFGNNEELIEKTKVKYCPFASGAGNVTLDPISAGKPNTYRITIYSSQVWLDRKFIDEVIRQAFSIWEEHSNLVFMHSLDEVVDVELQFWNKSYIKEHSKFLKQYGVQNIEYALAFQSASCRGILFNDERMESRIILRIAVHEIGHTLGLPHSYFSESVMTPVITPFPTGPVVLSTEDIYQIIALYGHREKKQMHNGNEIAPETPTAANKSIPKTYDPLVGKSISTLSGELNSTGLIIIVAISVVFVLIVAGLAIGIVFARFRSNTEVFLTTAETDEFLNGIQTNSQTPDQQKVTLIGNQPYNQKFEIVESQLKLDLTNILGSGNFGIVYKGSYMDNPVAVKTLKAGAEKSYLIALLSELKIMIHLAQHPNLICLIGAHTKFVQRGMLYIIVELCEGGSIETYLTKHRNILRTSCHYISPNDDDAKMANNFNVTENDVMNYPSTSNTSTLYLLVQWAYQISLAMEYLENKCVIHADLATRNVLLTDNLTAKVSDFGLSRKLYEYKSYVKRNQDPLPWRWMAIESLKKMEFSSKSDVWSFGVTLWELFTVGDVPYPGISYTIDFPNKLERGLRLYKPDLGPIEMYQIMQNCWKQNPEDRPNFISLRNAILEIFITFPNSHQDYIQIYEAD